MNNKNKCKYITTDSLTVYYMIYVLYDILEKQSGGLAHIVTDDNNLDDESLRFVITECNRKENKDKSEVNICKILCEALLRLSIDKRYFIFAYIENDCGDLEDLKSLSTNTCHMNNSNFCCSFCNLKYNLNKFIAENKMH